MPKRQSAKQNFLEAAAAHQQASQESNKKLRDFQKRAKRDAETIQVLQRTVKELENARDEDAETISSLEQKVERLEKLLNNNLTASNSATEVTEAPDVSSNAVVSYPVEPSDSTATDQRTANVASDAPSHSFIFPRDIEEISKTHENAAASIQLQQVEGGAKTVTATLTTSSNGSPESGPSTTAVDITTTRKRVVTLLVESYSPFVPPQATHYEELEIERRIRRQKEKDKRDKALWEEHHEKQKRQKRE